MEVLQESEEQMARNKGENGESVNVPTDLRYHCQQPWRNKRDSC